MKRKLVRNTIFVLLILLGMVTALGSGSMNDTISENASFQELMAEEYDPEINPANFVDEIDNPYFSLKPGTAFIYEGEEEGTITDVVIYVTNDTKEIMDVNTTVVRETEWKDGELVEDTYDWFAQDMEGNVWYFGENSTEYEDGEAVSTEDSWEAGVDGAKPGILVPGDPQIGDTFRQEYYEGEAEDMGQVVSLSENVTVPYGSFENCLVILEWNPLEPEVEENNYYAMDVGLVLERVVKGEDERLELVDIENFTSEYDPEIDPSNFTDEIDNPYFPLEPGTTFVYEGEDGDTTINVEISVTNQTKEVMGVNTTVVRETEWEDGELVEDTYDWFAQDMEGNVWYFGEETQEYEDGEAISTAGSWEAGVDGAKPGIIMRADPQIGDIYRQEYYEGEAEDMAMVISLEENVTVPYGSFEDCLVIREWTPLEPGIEENKYYATDIGLLLERTVKGGEARLELVDITTE